MSWNIVCSDEARCDVGDMLSVSVSVGVSDVGCFVCWCFCLCV